MIFAQTSPLMVSAMNRDEPSHITTLMPLGCLLLANGEPPRTNVALTPKLMLSLVASRFARSQLLPSVGGTPTGASPPSPAQSPVPLPQMLSDAMNIVKFGCGQA